MTALLSGCGRSTYDAAFGKSLGLLREVRGVLQDVTDEASAKVAADKFKAIRDKNDAIKAELDGLNPKPTHEQQQSRKNASADYIDLIKDIRQEEVRIRRYSGMKAPLDESLKWLDNSGLL
jgi:hypothetical protein